MNEKRTGEVHTPLICRLLTDLALAALAAGLFFALCAADSAASAPGRGRLAAASVNAAVYRGQSRGRAALLCTVGWNAASMETILQTLDESGARITFAVTARWAEQNPRLLEKIGAGGHEIAVMADAYGSVETEAELQRAVGAIEAACGARPTLFYCGDEYTPAKRRAAKALGLIPVVGTLDLICIRGSAEDIFRRAAGNTKAGDIAVCTPTAAFSDALPRILEYYSGMGLTAATVSGTIYD